MSETFAPESPLVPTPIASAEAFLNRMSRAVPSSAVAEAPAPVRSPAAGAIPIAGAEV